VEEAQAPDEAARLEEDTRTDGVRQLQTGLGQARTAVESPFAETPAAGGVAPAAEAPLVQPHREPTKDLTYPDEQDARRRSPLAVESDSATRQLIPETELHQAPLVQVREALSRREDEEVEAPPPMEPPPMPQGPAPRRTVVTQEPVRNQQVVDEVKRLHGYRCQVCGERLELRSGPYAECAHIQPLSHEGPDRMGNVLCLCPNHHKMFDGGSLSVADDFQLLWWRAGQWRYEGHLRTEKGHKIDRNCLAYHRKYGGATSD
jgi:hypothetical protein